MLEIYVDSSYDWNKTDNSGKGEGEIIVVIPSEAEIIKEKVVIQVKGLKQLNNRFELLAIQRAIDLMKKSRRKNFEIYSDSQTAVNWAKHPKVKWIPRERNLAGKIMENNKKNAGKLTKI